MALDPIRNEDRHSGLTLKVILAAVGILNGSSREKSSLPIPLLRNYNLRKKNQNSNWNVLW